ncbi:MAG: ecdysteroid 22-kinase family protein [Acidimicrobiales bacterium]|nr:ecdysteroid 22-kinase family protein [Acidimicrobiales bacterium]
MAKKKARFIPQEGSEFTADWFTDLFQEQYGAAVLDVSREVIGTGVGFVGEIHRCFLSWDATRGDLPTSVIVKVPSKLPLNRSLGEGLQLYEREVIAYEKLSSNMGLPMPNVLYSAMDDDPTPWLDSVINFLFSRLPLGGVSWLTVKFLELASKNPRLRRYVLVLEDIADARPPSQVEGGSLDDALISLATLAKFHAHHWMNEESIAVSDRIWALNRLPKVSQASYARNREEFIGRFGELVGDEKMRVIDDTQDRLEDLLAPLAQDPWTLLHGDYRLDNIMFRPNGEIVVIDYQLLSKGRPGWDVAYFITTALSADYKSEEETMLKHYHETLLRAGITNYSFEELVDDVELTKLLLAHRLVGSRDAFDTELQNSDETFVDVVVKRVVGWI